LRCQAGNRRRGSDRFRPDRLSSEIEPLPRGEYYSFTNAIKGGSVSKGYVPGIEKGLQDLKKSYGEIETSLMLKEEEKTWKLSLKADYLPLVEKLMPSTDLPKPVVETLAILAWRAPMLQSELIHLRSPVAYEHIAELEKIGQKLEEILNE